MHRKLLKQVLTATLLTLISGVVFSTYLVLVGVPRTQARQLYLEAEAAIIEQRFPQAEELLQRAISYWPEDYIKSRLIALQGVN